MSKSPKHVVMVNMAGHTTFHESMVKARNYVEDTLAMTAAFQKSNPTTGVNAVSLDRRLEMLRSMLRISVANLNATTYGKVIPNDK